MIIAENGVSSKKQLTVTFTFLLGTHLFKLIIDRRSKNTEWQLWLKKNIFLGGKKITFFPLFFFLLPLTGTGCTSSVNGLLRGVGYCFQEETVANRHFLFSKKDFFIFYDRWIIMEERLLDKIEAVNQVKSSTNFFLKWPSLILEKHVCLEVFQKFMQSKKHSFW